MTPKNYREWCYLIISIRTKTEVDKIDEVTWKQCVSNALRRAHGLFGGQIELYWLRIDNKFALIKVSCLDKEILETALATYISSSDLVGTPLAILIDQISYDIRSIRVSTEDQLWLNKVIMQEVCENS